MKMFTSALVLTLGLVTFSNGASAMVPRAPQTSATANCWVESGQDIADGQFTIALETNKVRKAALLEILSAITGKNISPLGFPLVFGDMMFIYVEGKDYSVGSHMMSRDELKATVHAEIDAILAMSKGVTASCVFNAYPAPAIGVRN